MDSFSESEQIPVNRVDEVPVKEGNQAQIESADKSLNLDDINHIIDDLDFSKVDLNLSFDVNVFEESGILAEETDSSNHLNETEKPLEIEGILEDPVESVKEEKKMRFPRAINRLAVYYHPACMNHDIPRHPEQPKRVQYILRALQSHFQQSQNVSFRLATQIAEEKILLFHTNYVLQSFLKKWEECKEIYDKQKKIVSRNIDGDTEVMHGTKDAAYFAAGSIINAIDHVYLPKEDNLAVDTAFCCVRPPGHHAEPNKAGGFCFFNNAGIGALYAREKYNIKRVAVLDFDVHHGNGTEEGFKDDEDLFYGSTHQRYCYPGSGPDPTPFIGDKSKTPLQRRIVDRMLTPGESSRKEFYMKWIQVLQEMELFKPELIIISAGFDAHDDDPLADVELLDEDYRWATAEVLKSGLRVNPSSPPKVVSILEGGYDLGAISRSAVLHVQSLYDGYESVVEEIVKENERKQMENHEGDEVEALKDYLQDLGI